VLEKYLDLNWREVLAPELQSDNFIRIDDFVSKAVQSGKNIFPPVELIFQTFNLISLTNIKVVILGQDPYHGAGEAHGLSFSVPRGIKIPPSLRNIYKALEKDIPGFKIPTHGCLQDWSEQGVFLLNSFLTVEENKAKSHEKIGWERFTDYVIQKISDNLENVVFMLWGNFAIKKSALIDASKHLVLEYIHPSPLNGNAFLSCNHFSRANNFLCSKGKKVIDWQIRD
jgi:uracil-DNA glycosylase